MRFMAAHPFFPVSRAGHRRCLNAGQTLLSSLPVWRMLLPVFPALFVSFEPVLHLLSVEQVAPGSFLNGRREIHVTLTPVRYCGRLDIRHLRDLAGGHDLSKVNFTLTHATILNSEPGEISLTKAANGPKELEMEPSMATMPAKIP